MMTFYAAAGSYQIRNEDGKDMPYIMRLGKLQPVSIPEFSIWSMLLWDVLTHDELRKKYFEKMEEVKLDPSGFEKALEMLVKRKLIIKGVGYTGADTCSIPMHLLIAMEIGPAPVIWAGLGSPATIRTSEPGTMRSRSS